MPLVLDVMSQAASIVSYLLEDEQHTFRVVCCSKHLLAAPVIARNFGAWKPDYRVGQAVVERWDRRLPYREQPTRQMGIVISSNLHKQTPETPGGRDGRHLPGEERTGRAKQARVEKRGCKRGQSA